MTAVFTVAAFLSATLLFAVQPLATRMVLPDFGGSAAVWTTSVLFFQTVLLLGYLYTHLATSWMRPRTQVRVHLLFFLVPAVALPLAVAAEPGEGGIVSVVGRLLLGLTLGVGLPFLLVSTSGPLLQRWFSWTDHPRAHDPYFLYAASNVGSILGLLTYPVLVEPWLDLRAQSWWWTTGYVLLGVLLLACAWFVTRRPLGATATPAATEIPAQAPTLAPPPPDDGSTSSFATPEHAAALPQRSQLGSAWRSSRPASCSASRRSSAPTSPRSRCCGWCHWPCTWARS